ncbi:hypothetical protein Tco_1330286 [Tanacetum coccineum]
MTTLADKSLLSGGDNKPSMLEKHLYDSWKSRMELYMMNRPHGRMILASVEKGPLVWPSITEDGVTRLKEYVELTPAEAIQADCDIKAINIILQGLPTEIYALVSQHRVAKDLWEKIKLLMQGTSLTKQERECKLYDEFDKFTYKKGETLHEYYLRFTLLLNDMNIYKMPLEQFQVNTKFLNTLPDEWSKFVTDVKLVKDLHTTNVDQLHAYLQQHERHANEVRLMHARNSDPLALVASHQLTQPAYQSHLHTHPKSLSQLHVSPYQSSQTGDDPIDAINHMMSFLTAVVTSRYPTTNNQLRTSSNPRQQATIYMEKGGSYCKEVVKPKRKRDETWFNDKVLLVQAQAGGQALTEEEIAFLADPGLPDIQTSQTVITHNAAYQADDLDAYDSDYALLSQKTEITSDSNIISYSQYLSEAQQETVQNPNSSAQQDVLILSMFEQLSTQVTHCTNVNQALTTELDRYKEEVKDLKEMQNVENSFLGSNEQYAEIVRLKQNLFEQVQEKDSLMKTVFDLKNDLKMEENRNIDREIALEKKIKQLDNIIFKRDNLIFIVNLPIGSDFGPDLDPYHSYTTVIVEVPKELPKVSMVNNSLKELKRYLTGFDQEEALVLRDIVKHVKANYPQDSLLESAFSIKANTEMMDSAKHQVVIRRIKVEAHPRNVKYSLNKRNGTVKVNGSAVVQNLKKQDNSDYVCINRDDCTSSDNLCVSNSMNDVKFCAKPKKNKSKKDIWKPTGKVFTQIGYIWKPTGRTFTVVGNACPLTRLTTTNEVPSRKPIVLESESPKPVVKLVYSRKLRIRILSPVSKTKCAVVQVVIEIDQVAKIMVMESIRGLGNVTFKEGVDVLTGSQGDNLYTLSLGNFDGILSICYLSKGVLNNQVLVMASSSISLEIWCYNHLARTGLVRGLTYDQVGNWGGGILGACSLVVENKRRVVIGGVVGSLERSGLVF